MLRADLFLRFFASSIGVTGPTNPWRISCSGQTSDDFCKFLLGRLNSSRLDRLPQQHTLVLSTEDKENYLEHHIPAAPVALPGQQVPPEALAAHAAWVKGQKEVVVLMLLTMDLEIQRNLAHLGAYDMLQELKAMFSKQAEQELLQTVREFHTCKQEEVSLSLVSLNKELQLYANTNMHDMGKTVNELHAMLKLHEDSLPKKDVNPALHAIRARRVQKN
ncbi:hypothetical protein Tco_1420717 [Tanacetum coccineum]